MSRIDVVIRGAGVLVVAGVLAGGGAYVIQDGGEAATANLWIDENGGPCTRSSSLVEYVDANSCDTFVEACAAASAGDTVAYADGTYPAESVYRTAAAGQATPCDFASETTFMVPEGGNVTFTGQWLIGDANVGAGQLGPRNLKLLNWTLNKDTAEDAWIKTWEAEGLHVDNMDANEVDFGGRQQDPAVPLGILIENSTFSGCFGVFEVTSIACITRSGASGITWRNNDFHDYHSGEPYKPPNPPPNCVDGSTCPRGVAMLVACDGDVVMDDVTLERNRFWNMPVLPVRVQPRDTCEMTNLVIRNNWFGCVDPALGWQNSFNGSISLDSPSLDDPGLRILAPKIYGNTMCQILAGVDAAFNPNQNWSAGSEVWGNLMLANDVANTGTVPATFCADSDLSSRYNLRYPGSSSLGDYRCHSTDIDVAYDADLLAEYVVGPLFGDDMDLGLKASTAANNAWLSSSCSVLGNDILGVTRPVDTDCDIGAKERDD